MIKCKNQFTTNFFDKYKHTFLMIFLLSIQYEVKSKENST